jgi:hypothetical protein
MDKYNKYNKYNTFFYLQENIYLYICHAKNMLYDYQVINNQIFIKNKNIHKNDHFILTFINNNKQKQKQIHVMNHRQKIIILPNYHNIAYTSHIHDHSIKEIVVTNFLYFDITYYIYNNSYVSSFKMAHDFETFVYYHWFYCGRFNPNHYFKYLLKKYSPLITNLPYPKITYDECRDNTLLFIDDRYDPSFYYLMQLFLYSVDETWNITIITTNEHAYAYEEDLKKLGVSAKIKDDLPKFKNVTEYSNYLKKPSLWMCIPESNCLLFQYDSFCMGKFNPIFFNYNYIGALWDHKPSLFYKNMIIGNGGTSFRKTRIMELICKKYEHADIKKDYAEDIFFSELLTDNFLHNCTEELASKFSFEAVFNKESLYGHQIYMAINHKDLEGFMYRKLRNMLDSI